MSSQLVPPHGASELKILLLEGDLLKEEKQRAESFVRVTLSSREKGDLVMLGTGGFTPLEGFMGQGDWLSVCQNMCLTNGIFWPIPITLSVGQSLADSLQIGQEVALVDPDSQEIMGSLLIDELYRIDKNLEAKAVFKTMDVEHPGVKMLMEQPEVNVAGKVKVFSEGGFRDKYQDVYFSPKETRAMLDQRGWRTVAAFQTRNPMHRSHEYLAKIALEVCDGVLIHSLLGQLKAGDIPAEVRQEAIKVLIDGYFVKDSVIQAGYPLDMRYAGPREALLHALFRQNYGCSHLIVGRDHAGVGEYYGPFDAQVIFDEIPKTALITQPLKIDWTFWCNQCAAMASTKTCPHTPEHRVLVSGTKLRKMLSEGEQVPDNFSRPEVLAVLRQYYVGLAEHERVKVELKGHSAK